MGVFIWQARIQRAEKLATGFLPRVNGGFGLLSSECSLLLLKSIETVFKKHFSFFFFFFFTATKGEIISW